jgi:hypothetical protein
MNVLIELDKISGHDAMLTVFITSEKTNTSYIYFITSMKFNSYFYSYNKNNDFSV